MAIWQRERQGADPTGPGPPLPTARGPATGRPANGQAPSEADAVASVGSKGDLLSTTRWPRHRARCRAELIGNKGPRAVHRRRPGTATAQWVHWAGTTRPHSAIDMHTPDRARDHLGPRHQTPATSTTTTPNQQPPEPDKPASKKPGA